MSTDNLHAAVCNAVVILNAAPELQRYKEGRDVRDILRQALIDYADSFMDAPVTPGELRAVDRKHGRKTP